MDFTGKHVIVTGASSGIGEATARTIAARGGSVMLIARREERLAKLAIEMGPGTRWFAADVGDAAAQREALEQAVEAGGSVDGLFLNAGTGGSFAPVEDYGDDAFEQVLGVNLLAPYRAIAQLLPAMKARKTGAILVTGSLASERGMANNTAYVASKHAVLGLARAVALEAAPHGVRCNCIVPGFIETEMFAALPSDALEQIAARVPQGRTGSAQELAEVAAFLLSDAASHVTGQSLAVDGGVLGTLSV